MEKGKQVMLVDEEEPKPLRVCYILRRFFRYAEEHPEMFRGIIAVEEHPDTDEEDGTWEYTCFFARDAALIISEYDIDEMDEDKALELVKRVNTVNRLDLIRMIICGKETREALRVCFDKVEDVLVQHLHLDALLGLPPLLEDQEFEIRDWDYFDFVLGQCLLYVEQVSPNLMFPVKRVYEDLALLQAFLIDRPQQFFNNHRLMQQISYLVERVANIIRAYEPRKEMVKFLDFVFKILSHWMDVIRIIYGKHPKAVYCFVDNLAPLDALLDYHPQFHMMDRILTKVLFVRAILTDPPQKLIEDGTLKHFEFIAREVGFTISSIDLNNMDDDMADYTRELLDETFTHAGLQWRVIESIVKEVYAKRPKPPRMYYPKTAQLEFVDLVVDNLGELLLKAQTENAPLIRLLKFDILQLQRKLQEVSWHLMEIPEPRKQEADVKDNITNVANLAYEAEYVIDSFLLADIPISSSMLWLRDIHAELCQQQLLIKTGFGDVESIVHSILSEHIGGPPSIVPIFDNSNEIGDALDKVFNERWFHFAVCTRSSVSSYTERKKEVLLDLLRNAKKWGFSDSDKIDYSDYPSDMSEAELERLLYVLVGDKRYLVILKDVQDIYALNDIKRVLPESQEHKSVILFTTSSSELVLQCRYGFNQMSEHHPSTSQTDEPTIEKDVVGFTEETMKMLDQLIRGPKEMLRISIVGTAGQGKTTLATKLFNHPSVKEHFYIRALCCISQTYEKRQLLLELLRQVVQPFETIHRPKNDVELAEILYKQLKGQRFLIFLDDVWKIDSWNDLARCFPDDKKGSRIILTTRIHELAETVNSIPQPLGLLSDEESWKLLQKKLFLNECCPIELLEVGRKIAENCKGLPLSVVLIAGLLRKIEKKVDQWERIAKNLSSLILNDSEAKGKGIIEMSYNHLPNHLKSCFLYFGAILEDREVQVSNLIRLWIGEGFVKHSDLKSLEDVAEDYVGDLVRRSLVTIAQEKSNGGVKSCLIHDLLREFCLTKASEEYFLKLLNGYDEQDFSFHHHQGVGNSSSSTMIEHHFRRLCIQAKSDHFTMLKPSGPFVRSMLFFASSDICPNYSSNISFIFYNFKFLKTLNLEDINVGDSFKEIGGLILLRYLACQSDVDLIPPSIANLWNLQTLLFKGLGPEVVKVSYLVWDMTKLRHMHINDSASFDLGPDRLENSSILDNLQTFSTPSLAYGDDTKKMLRRIRGIRKLKCMFLDSWDAAANCNKFPELEFLSQLLSLNVFYSGKGKYPCKFNFPSNLKKLTLSNFRMPWNEISQLAHIWELEVLKLLGDAFEGETWEMEDVVFPKLKFLKLDTLNVIKWNATNDNFPSLERLLLHKCVQLDEIPPDIGEIQTLQMIEVIWCNASTAISAIRIQEEQLDYGLELKLHVHPKYDI